MNGCRGTQERLPGWSWKASGGGAGTAPGGHKSARKSLRLLLPFTSTQSTLPNSTPSTTPCAKLSNAASPSSPSSPIIPAPTSRCSPAAAPPHTPFSPTSYTSSGGSSTTRSYIFRCRWCAPISTLPTLFLDFTKCLFRTLCSAPLSSRLATTSSPSPSPTLCGSGGATPSDHEKTKGGDVTTRTNQNKNGRAVWTGGEKTKEAKWLSGLTEMFEKMAFPCVFGHADPTVAIIASSPSAWMLAKKAVHTHLHSLHELRSAGGRTLQPSVFCNRGFGRTSAFATRPSRSEWSPAAHQAWIWISDQIRLKDASFHSFHS